MIFRLPVTVSLNRGSHDYCGNISPALSYDEKDVQHGWKNGDLAFWTVGNDFVIFHSDEENSSSTGDIVNIGAVTSDIETVRSLGQNINMTIALAENEDNNSDEDNDMITKMKITVNGHTLTATLEDNARTRGYEVGEIVYYPPMHSFVIMYKQNGEHFQMQSIGRIDSGVEVFDGIGDIDVKFEEGE